MTAFKSDLKAGQRKKHERKPKAQQDGKPKERDYFKWTHWTQRAKRAKAGKEYGLCFQDLDNPYFHKTDFNHAAATNRCIEIIEAAGGFVERIWRYGYAEEISFTIPNGIEVPFKKDDPHFTATVLRTGKAIQWPTTLNRITPASADGGGVNIEKIIELTEADLFDWIAAGFRVCL